MSFGREVPRGISLMRYSETAGGHGGLMEEGPATEEIDEGAMTGRIRTASTEEAGKKGGPLAGLEDSQFTIPADVWQAILTVEGAVEGAVDAPVGESSYLLLLLGTSRDCNV